MPSSPPLRFSDLEGRAVGVFGIGVEGEASIARLAELGVVPRVLVDDRPRSGEVLATAAGGLDALAGCEIVIKAPGISRHGEAVRSLERAGVAVVGGLGLWLEEVGPARVIGVTGTKGKSTTTSVAGHLARGLGVRCGLGGNLGVVPWAPSTPGDVDLWVIEVSSYQATDLWSSPAVVAVTSLHEDHLDWHGGAEQYFADKLGLCGRPGAVITVANGGDPLLRSFEESLRPGPRWVVASETDASWVDALGLRGAHNVANALIAAACLQEIGVEGADQPGRLAAAAAGYEPLPHRLETVAVLGGVEYVDDSLSTNVLPTIAAAEVFAGRPLALLLGGHDRGIDYQPLARWLAGREAPTLVLTLPQNGDRVAAAVTAAGGTSVACPDISTAVERAAAWVPPGGVVLLSPAAASYGLYADHRARGGAFRDAVGQVAARLA
jgi:UDP-N-acetylmuramoylalanine--D-glutamate ligase